MESKEKNIVCWSPAKSTMTSKYTLWHLSEFEKDFSSIAYLCLHPISYNLEENWPESETLDKQKTWRRALREENRMKNDTAGGKIHIRRSEDYEI